MAEMKETVMEEESPVKDRLSNRFSSAAINQQTDTNNMKAETSTFSHTINLITTRALKMANSTTRIWLTILMNKNRHKEMTLKTVILSTSHKVVIMKDSLGMDKILILMIRDDLLWCPRV